MTLPDDTTRRHFELELELEKYKLGELELELLHSALNGIPTSQAMSVSKNITLAIRLTKRLSGN